MKLVILNQAKNHHKYLIKKIAEIFEVTAIISELESISDIPRTLSKISIGKSNPRDIINLCQSLYSIHKIKKHVLNNKILKKAIGKTKSINKICNKNKKS